ncbi:hypothetical protein HWC68_gp09 [Gordonia phage Gibbin]|uniref:Uncharacterized protein n=2 Tax=Lambovirus TaxID=2843412 RepID=A0A5J6TP89_9CAUD|nr:hypothetical protein HWC68_gp09 [Gordonia phage Gibbin]YP_009853963.1 hypothetical protein HWC82_gp09 [Gordonia phage Yikes]QFG10552.1 hypothetical protein PBI_GIBBIN_9 [Gordonia phage Gibbin]QGJ90999.1 hypothetical protein PBI_YIKES_9 [Gordonia phage Yikes]
MAKKRYKKYRRRVGGNRAWGNALGGYRTQARVDGQFASGKGGNRKSASARRAEGYRKKQAKDRKRRNRRNATVGAAVGATIVVGAGAYAVHKSRQSKASATNGVQMKTFRSVQRRPKKIVPVSVPKPVPTVGKTSMGRKDLPKRPVPPKSIVEQARHIQGQRAASNERIGTFKYRGSKQEWRDPNNKNKRHGTLKPGAQTNGSQDIFTGVMPRATGRLTAPDANALNAAMEDFAKSQGIQLGVTARKTVRRTPKMTKGQLAGALRKDRARHRNAALANSKVLWHGVQTGQVKTVPGTALKKDGKIKSPYGTYSASYYALRNGSALYDAHYTQKGTLRARRKKIPQMMPMTSRR